MSAEEHVICRTSRRGAVACALAGAGLALLPVGAAAQGSVTGTAALSPAERPPVALAAGAPARRQGTALRFAVASLSGSATAQVGLRGGLRLRAGGRSATVGALRVTLGRSRSSLSGTIGGRRVTLATITPRRAAPVRVAADSATLTRATVRLAPSGARAAGRALRLRAAPSTRRRLGTLTLTARRTAPVAVAPGPLVAGPVAAPAPPAPAPAAPIPDPGPTPPPTPGPNACWQDRGPTPAGSTDWIACSQPGGNQIGLGNLRSWLNYLRRPFVMGDSSAELGATRVVADSPYDVRLPGAPAVGHADGSVTIPHRGRIAYRGHAGALDSYVEDLRFRVSPDRRTATVTATARFRDGGPNEPPTGPEMVEQLEIVTVDLTAAVRSTVAAGVRTFEHAPAVLTAEGQEVYSEEYPVGASWGAFTIAVPERATP